MKKMILIVVVFLFAFSVSFASEDSDVKGYVRSQINSAIGIEKVQDTQESGISSVTLIKLMILLTASIGSFGYVFFRRRKLTIAEKEKELKEKIKVLREEKISYEMEPRLKMIRRKLSDTVPEGNVNLKVVPQSAKRLNISQEEIILAARLNFYSKQSEIGGSIA